MRLENYIMEQDINTASVADIFVEQAQAEMNVMISIAESYSKEAYYDEFVQEGAVKDAATVAKGSKYESKIKRIVAFLPRFIANLFKIVIGKIKKTESPIAAIKSKFSKVPEDVKGEAVIPISKENLSYALKIFDDFGKLADRVGDIDWDAISSGQRLDATFNGKLLKATTECEKFIKYLDNIDVEKRIQTHLEAWKREQDRQKKANTSLSEGKTTFSVKVDDGVSGNNTAKPTMPDLVIKTEETKDLATIKEFEDFAKKFVEQRKELEANLKKDLDNLNRVERYLKGKPETSSTGVETITSVPNSDSDSLKYFTDYMNAYKRVGASITKFYDGIEKAFAGVLKDTKAYKAYKAPKRNDKYNDDSVADNYKVDWNSGSEGNWGSQKTRSGGGSDFSEPSQWESRTRRDAWSAATD